MAQPVALVDDLGVTTGAWLAFVRRARIGPANKLAALVVASYADADGSRVFAGVDRLALDLECSRATAKRRLEWLRDAGLIQCVRRANRRRRLADEYRLILAPHVLEKVDVPTPSEYDAMISQLKKSSKSTNRPVDNPDQLGLTLVSPDLCD